MVESRLLDAIQNDLFTEEGFAVVRQEVARLLVERRRRQGPGLTKTKARLAKVEQEIAHMIEAHKQGVVTSSTKAELVKIEGEQQQLEETLERT
ncbi:MAG TPA: hypothetical protein VN666_18515 [Nitrospira sp.]|nr:hypothetical protein [Nitrospira sp.]